MGAAGAEGAGRRPLHLTFDDGPGPEGTRAVLRALEAVAAPATFFVLGARLRAHPELVRELLASGHRIELHGDAHLDHRTADAVMLERDTDAAMQTLRASGVEPVWWRLPWGRPGPATATEAQRHGLRIIGWDADTHDWRGDGPGDQPAAFHEAAEHGGVVLMHDGFGPGATRSRIENTIALLEDVVARARRAGTPVAALPDPTASLAGGLPVAGAEHEPVSSR